MLEILTDARGMMLVLVIRVIRFCFISTLFCIFFNLSRSPFLFSFSSFCVATPNLGSLFSLPPSFSLTLSLSFLQSLFLFNSWTDFLTVAFFNPILPPTALRGPPPWPSVSSAVEGAPALPNTLIFGECATPSSLLNSLAHRMIG